MCDIIKNEKEETEKNENWLMEDQLVIQSSIFNKNPFCLSHYLKSSGPFDFHIFFQSIAQEKVRYVSLGTKGGATYNLIIKGRADPLWLIKCDSSQFTSA